MDTELVDQAEQVSTDMRQEIDDTRSAMADKMEALEDRVMDTVQSAQETVDDSIQIASDTVASVKRTFDIKHHVEQHPWTMVGGSILAGLALGSLFLSVRQRTRPAPRQGDEGRLRRPGSAPFSIPQGGNGNSDSADMPRFQAAPPPSRPGVFDRFHEEIDKVRGMAIGYAMGLVRDSIKDAVPQMASQIEDVMNSITTKFGAESVHQHSKK